MKAAETSVRAAADTSRVLVVRFQMSTVGVKPVVGTPLTVKNTEMIFVAMVYPNFGELFISAPSLLINTQPHRKTGKL